MELGTVIDRFPGITLKEMDKVKLMNRTDRKYWFGGDLLLPLLEAVIDDYFLLEIGGERNLPYSTIYYDTIGDDQMYSNHHRGKLNRYKIRRRNYTSTQQSYLEVKFKSNKGRTVKVRQRSDYSQSGFSESDAAFIEAKSPYRSGDLKQVLSNGFRRLMLVSRSLNERCTIDSELCFVGEAGEVSLGGLVIVEVKTDGRSRSAIIEAMRDLRIKGEGFSKYCMGRTLTTEGLRSNNFKRRCRLLEKRIGKPVRL